MTTKTLITVLLLAGYVAALPALLWGLADLRHIPGGVWRHAAQRPRAQWRAGMITAYALGGWPAFVSVRFAGPHRLRYGGGRLSVTFEADAGPPEADYPRAK